MGIRPSPMLIGGKAKGKWTEMDKRLLEAYQTMKDESCGHCGHPVWLCRNENVMWAVETDICNADEALEKWREGKTDSKGKTTIKPGVHPYVKPYVLKFNEQNEPVEDFTDLPSRNAYFQPTTV